MGREISLAIMAHENFSDAVTTMRNANQAFNKDLTGTMQKLDAFNKNKITLKVETDKAKQALKEAEKQFSKTGDAADKMALELANSNYENARRNLDLVAKNARQAEKDILSMTGAISKAENRAGTSSAAESTMMKTLSNAGLFKMAGDSLSGLAGVAVSSALGNTIGGAIQSTLSSAATGAAMGSLAGLPGMAIGAGVGALAGGVSALTNTFSSQDDALKSAVQETYNTVKQEQENTLTSGVTIAGQREQDQIAFSQRLGSDKAAEEYLAKTKTMATKTNYSYDDITGYSKSLLNSYKPDEVFKVLQTLSDASGGLNLDSQGVNMFISGLSRMRTTGKATQEYLNYFSERGLDVYKALSNATGADESKIAGMVTKGDISGDTAAQAIIDYINETFGGLSEKQSTTYNAMVDNLQDLQNEMDAAMGEGFTEERKKGLTAQQEYLSGESGEKQKEANRLIGQYQASLENAREQAIRDAQDRAMETDEYKKAKLEDDGAEMGRILAAAKADAEAEYRNSEAYQQQYNADKTLVGNIRDAMIQDGTYKTFGYDMAQEFSKGFGKKYAEDLPSILSQIYQPENSLQSGGSKVASEEDFANSLSSLFRKKPAGKAFGMARVPYNDFPAMLHEGERVLTASEARSRSAAPNIKVEVTGNIIKDEADEDRIAQKIVTKILNAMQNM